MEMEANLISRKVTNNSKKPVIRQEVINFKRRKISENDQNFTSSQGEDGVIFLDTDTALEPEPLTIEIDMNDEELDEQKVLFDIEDDTIAEYVEEGNEQEYDLHQTEIVAEELGDGEHPLDDLELEEGEVQGLDFLRRQFRTHYNREYQCPLCERSFSQKGNLMRHYQTHTGAKPFACYLCGHRFTQKSNLQKHIATHNGDKKFECGVCHKGFVQKANLIRHLRIHTGEKPFQCDLCGHKFTQKGNLNKHMQLHTSDAEVSCDFCESSFTSYSSKVKHESVAHPDRCDERETEEMIIRQNYHCEECPAVFRTEKSLNRHKKFHE